MITIFGRVKRYTHTQKGTFVAVEYDQKGKEYKGHADIFVRATVSPAAGTAIFACGNHEIKPNERNGKTYQNLQIWADQYIDDKAAVTAAYNALFGQQQPERQAAPTPPPAPVENEYGLPF